MFDTVTNEAIERRRREASVIGVQSTVPVIPDYIMPKGTDHTVAPVVAEAVARTALETGMARVTVDPAAIGEKVRHFVYEGRLTG